MSPARNIKKPPRNAEERRFGLPSDCHASYPFLRGFASRCEERSWLVPRRGLTVAGTASDFNRTSADLTPAGNMCPATRGYRAHARHATNGQDAQAVRRRSRRSECHALRGWRAGGGNRRARRTAASGAQRPERPHNRAALGGRASVQGWGTSTYRPTVRSRRWSSSR
jgi:hypothetical protein